MLSLDNFRNAGITPVITRLDPYTLGYVFAITFDHSDSTKYHHRPKNESAVMENFFEGEEE